MLAPRARPHSHGCGARPPGCRRPSEDGPRQPVGLPKEPRGDAIYSHNPDMSPAVPRGCPRAVGARAACSARSRAGALGASTDTSLAPIVTELRPGQLPASIRGGVERRSEAGRGHLHAARRTRGSRRRRCGSCSNQCTAWPCCRETHALLQCHPHQRQRSHQQARPRLRRRYKAGFRQHAQQPTGHP